MFSERIIDGINRDPEQYFMRYNSAKPELGGCKKTNTAKSKAEASEELIALRKRWADLQNDHLERHGHADRVDHRTLRAQGIDREPEIHLGPVYCQNQDIKSAILKKREAQKETEKLRLKFAIIYKQGVQNNQVNQLRKPQTIPTEQLGFNFEHHANELTFVEIEQVPSKQNQRIDIKPTLETRPTQTQKLILPSPLVQREAVAPETESAHHLTPKDTDNASVLEQHKAAQAEQVVQAERERIAAAEQLKQQKLNARAEEFEARQQWRFAEGRMEKEETPWEIKVELLKQKLAAAKESNINVDRKKIPSLEHDLERLNQDMDKAVGQYAKLELQALKRWIATRAELKRLEVEPEPDANRSLRTRIDEGLGKKPQHELDWECALKRKDYIEGSVDRYTQYVAKTNAEIAARNNANVEEKFQERQAERARRELSPSPEPEQTINHRLEKDDDPKPH
ncbi:MAG: hypothetical protein NVSMB70_13820 [Chamaesiphon sp.]